MYAKAYYEELVKFIKENGDYWAPFDALDDKNYILGNWSLKGGDDTLTHTKNGEVFSVSRSGGGLSFHGITEEGFERLCESGKVRLFDVVYNLLFSEIVGLSNQTDEYMDCAYYHADGLSAEEFKDGQRSILGDSWRVERYPDGQFVLDNTTDAEFLAVWRARDKYLFPF